MRSIASVAKSIRSACPSAPSSDASWSSSPVSAPTQSFSTREQSFASSTRSGSSAPATPSSARHSAVSSAAEEDSPDALGDVARERDAGRHELDARGGELGHDAARERAPALGGLRRRRARTRRVSPRSSATTSTRSPVERLGGRGHAAVDRERQREAAVVVGVLADQVDAAGAARANRRGGPGRRRRRRCRCRGRGRGRCRCRPRIGRRRRRGVSTGARASRRALERAPAASSLSASS